MQPLVYAMWHLQKSNTCSHINTEILLMHACITHLPHSSKSPINSFIKITNQFIHQNFVTSNFYPIRHNALQLTKDRCYVNLWQGELCHMGEAVLAVEGACSV